MRRRIRYGRARYTWPMRTTLLVVAIALAGCTDRTTSKSAGAESVPLPACEWCGAQDAPEALTAVASLAGPDEPGTPIVLRGVVYQPDGVTPAPGVLLYAYNTDDTGVYRREGTETGNGRRHGQLRGWLRTDAAGRYEIRTIYPGGYPGRPDPSHVHITLTPAGGREVWVDSTLFDGDPRLTDDRLAEHAGEGRFSAIVVLAEGGSGVLVGERDLRIPGR